MDLVSHAEALNTVYSGSESGSSGTALFASMYIWSARLSLGRALTFFGLRYVCTRVCTGVCGGQA